MAEGLKEGCFHNFSTSCLYDNISDQFFLARVSTNILFKAAGNEVSALISVVIFAIASFQFKSKGNPNIKLL